MDHVLYHYPGCGTSRTTLALLREAGIEPKVVLYRENPLDVEQLRALSRALGGSARTLLRSKEPLCTELGLDAPEVEDERILAEIAAHPELFNRPIVIGPRGARVCRPAEVVKELI